MQNLEVQNKLLNVIPAQVGISLIVILLLIGCDNKTFSDEQELWQYVKDETNGYIQHKKVNDIDFTLLYKPTDLLVHQELGDSKDAKKISVLREKYKAFMYFNLSMSKKNKEMSSGQW